MGRLRKVRGSIVITAVLGLLAGGCGSGSRMTSGAPASAPESAATGAANAPRPVSGGLAARADAAVKRLIDLGKPVYCGGGRGNAVALTFDDGPGPYTPFAIKRLRRNHDRATFFLVARNLPVYGPLVAREAPFGEIADHTRTHPLLTALSPSARQDEIVGAQRAISAASHRPVRLFRPPYGGRDAQVDAVTRQNRMLQILWNVDSADSLGANHSQILKNVAAGLRPGSIILMHDNRGQTIRALPPILHALRNRHLRAVTVAELMAIDPPSAAQLQKGLNGCPHYPEVGDTLTARTPHPN